MPESPQNTFEFTDGNTYRLRDRLSVTVEGSFSLDIAPGEELRLVRLKNNDPIIVLEYHGATIILNDPQRIVLSKF